jgi:FixJ family two-component response regulator
MPGMSGPDLARDLTTRSIVKRVVFVSGYVDDETTRAGVLADARHLLFKPFTPEALARKVREALDERAPDTA